MKSTSNITKPASKHLIYTALTVLLLNGCAAKYTPTGLIGEPAEPTAHEYILSCADFNTLPGNKSVYIEFEASPTLTTQLQNDLRAKKLNITTNKDTADLQYLVQSRFYAMKSFNGRVAQFEQVGKYVEDPKREVYTEIPPRKKGLRLDLTYIFDPALFIGANLGANFPMKKDKATPWIQGTEGNPDAACRLRKHFYCPQYLFEQAMATTLTEQRSGSTCTIESKLFYYQALPELFYPEHIRQIEEKLSGQKQAQAEPEGVPIL